MGFSAAIRWQAAYSSQKKIALCRVKTVFTVARSGNELACQQLEKGSVGKYIAVVCHTVPVFSRQAAKTALVPDCGCTEYDNSFFVTKKAANFAAFCQFSENITCFAPELRHYPWLRRLDQGLLRNLRQAQRGELVLQLSFPQPVLRPQPPAFQSGH